MEQNRIGLGGLLAIGTFLACLCVIGLLACASLALPQTRFVSAASSTHSSTTLQAATATLAAKPQNGSQAPAPAAPATSKLRGRRRIVTGQVVETRQWCGGVNPPDELLDALRKETPVPSKTLYVRSGSVNSAKRAVVLQFTTDAQGNFKIALPEGVYCIVEESKKDKLQMPNLAKLNKDLPETQRYELSSPDCLENWWNACDYNLKVGKQNVRSVVIKFHRTCNPPCILGGPQPV